MLDKNIENPLQPLIGRSRWVASVVSWLGSLNIGNVKLRDRIRCGDQSLSFNASGMRNRIKYR